MRTLTLLSLLLVGHFAYSTTYTTIANGSWDNTTDVWSTDSVSPCLCYSGMDISGDEVIVDHVVQLAGGDLLLSLGARLTINEDGAIEAPNTMLDVRMSTVFAAGDMELMKLLIGRNGTVEVNTAELVVHQQEEMLVIL